MKTRYYLIAGTMATVATSSAFAAPDQSVIDQKTVASKYYVDTLKQAKLGPMSTGEQHPTTGQTISLTDTAGKVNNLYLAGGARLTLTKADGARPIGEFLGGNDISESNSIDRDDVDNALVTLRLLQDVYSELNNSIDNLSWTAFTWDSAATTGTNNYSIAFSGGNWTTGTSGYLVTALSLAKGLQLKQKILPAKTTGNDAPVANQAVVLGTEGYPSQVYTTGSGSQALTGRTGAPTVINYVNGTTTLSDFTGGTFGASNASSATYQGYVKNALVSLELLKDVYGALHDTLEWSTSGTGNTQTATDKYSTTFDGTANNWKVADQTRIVTGDSLAKGLARKQNKMECAGWYNEQDGESAAHTDANCWVWKVRD